MAHPFTTFPVSRTQLRVVLPNSPMVLAISCSDFFSREQGRLTLPNISMVITSKETTNFLQSATILGIANTNDLH